MVFGSLSVPVAGASAKWTFAIYMCADNDLDAYAELNMEWLMTADTSSDVNFLVFWDSFDGPAKLWKITHDQKTELTGFSLDNTEVNMGNPAVLTAFVDFVNNNFAATNVLLDLWDHGDDFRGICYDYHSGTSAKYDLLTHQEITLALKGKHVDIIAADGCGIGTVEVAYEYAIGGIEADWFVANENYVPLDGFPYDVIAADLVKNPDMTPEQLSLDMVARYAEYYQGGWLTELAAIDLQNVVKMVDELWDVTAILNKNMAIYRGLIGDGKGQAHMGWSQYGWEATLDLKKVFEVISMGVPADSDLGVEVAELLTAMETAVPYIGEGSPAYVWEFGGLAVFFPGSYGSFVHNAAWRGSLYPTMQFAEDGWMDFLHAFWMR